MKHEEEIEMSVIGRRPQRKVLSEISRSFGSTIRKAGMSKDDVRKMVKDIRKEIRLEPAM